VHAGEDLLLTARSAAEGYAVAIREVNRLRNAHGLVSYFPRRATLHVRGNSDCALTAEVLHLRWTLVMRDPGDLFERHHHIAAADGDGQMIDVGCVDAIFRM